MSTDDPLAAAVAALRAPRPASPDQAYATRQRVLATLAEKRRRGSLQPLATAAAAVLALALGSTAWALATGRLGPARPVPARAALAPPRAVSSHASPAPRPVPLAVPLVAPSSAEPPPALHAPAPSLRAASTSLRAGPRAQAAASAPRLAAVGPLPAPAAVDDGDELYQRAHFEHFSSRNMPMALERWDAYLRAAPEGRFAPEARFNRVVVLVRLGHRDEALASLRALASSDYRRQDVARLLLALSPDAGLSTQ